MHDQNKMFTSNEYYHAESRYAIDDSMIDELMIAGPESLSDLSHLDSSLNKASHIPLSSTNMMALANEDYYNQYAFNQMTNMMMNNNNNSGSTNGNMNNNATLSNSGYTFHTLQAPNNQANTGYCSPLMVSNPNMNSSYLALGGNGLAYGSKIASRSPSYNSGGASSSSSPSSSLLSTTSNNNLLTQSVQQNSNNVSSSTNDFELDSTSAASTSVLNAATVASEQAELIRQKQMRGVLLTQEELQLLAKDRQRKDNHNMIERRRRFNINDRIKELGLLLPKMSEQSDSKQNKGSILKASVDYIHKIRNDIEEAKQIQETNKYLISLNKRLYNKIKDLEMLCRAHGISTGNPTNLTNTNSNYSVYNNNPNKNELENQLNFQHNSAQPLYTNNNNLNCTVYTSNSTLNNTNDLMEIHKEALKSPELSTVVSQDCQISTPSGKTRKARNGGSETKRQRKDDNQNMNIKSLLNEKQHKSDSNNKLKEEPISPKNRVANAGNDFYKSMDQNNAYNQTNNNNSLDNNSVQSVDMEQQRNLMLSCSNESNRQKHFNQVESLASPPASPLINLMVSSSKNPTLTSSSISSPPPPPSENPVSTSQEESTSSSIINVLKSMPQTLSMQLNADSMIVQSYVTTSSN